MTNYAEPGGYTAYKKQAPDAVELTALLQEAVSAEEEMRAAADVANQAAPLCGEQRIDLKLVMHIVPVVGAQKSVK